MTKVKLPFSAFSVIVVFVIFAIIGLALTPLLSLKLEPDKTGNMITVSFSYPGASQDKVEQEVTSNIEGILSLIKGVKKTSSVSASGYGYVKAELSKDAKTTQLRFEIATLIRQLYKDLPEGVSYPQISTNDYSEKGTSLLTYSLVGNNSASYLKTLAETSIKRELSSLKGIYQINIYGANDYAWEIKFDQNKLDRLDITRTDVEQRIYNNNKTLDLGKSYEANYPGSKNFTFNYTSLKTTYPIPFDLGQIPIKKDQRLIYLKDLATIRLVEQKPNSYFRINGNNTINIDVVAAPHTNNLVLAEQIKHKISAIQSKLPQANFIILQYDSTKLLREELDNIIIRTTFTLVFLLLAIFLISREFRYMLLMAISIIINLCVACSLFYYYKLDIHLYSLAGITISIGVMIDNSIVVIDHIRYRSNLRILLAVAGTTLTSIGSVIIVFFLSEELQTKLLDLAWVIIVNMSISLLVSLFLLPALMEKISLKKSTGISSVKRMRRIGRWNHRYSLMTYLCYRYRAFLFGFLILLFGTPVFRLPKEIKSDNKIATLYNKTLGSDFYNNLRPWVDAVLGGSLRLFLLKSHQTEDQPLQQSKLTVDVFMPNGISVALMNDLVIKWESFIKRYPQVKTFQSRIYSGELATITIMFKPEFEKGSAPFKLKKELERKAAHAGLSEFDIRGVGKTFNNRSGGILTNFALVLKGYNYPTLKKYSNSVKSVLTANPRVKSIKLDGERTNIGVMDNFDYVLRIAKPEKLLLDQTFAKDVNTAFNKLYTDSKTITYIPSGDNYLPVVTASSEAPEKWLFMNDAADINRASFIRAGNFSTIDKEAAGYKIIKENQQYQIVVNFDFIGDRELVKEISDDIVDNFTPRLPLGYSIEASRSNFFDGAEKELLWAILITVGIVFLICTILLNSIKQAGAVVAFIPVSFIGVFFAVYLFEYNFDEGGYAALIFLCGLVVSAPLFILNDFNNLKREHPGRQSDRLFVKAFNTKIIPVTLSRISIILALLPFIVFKGNEAFWEALAISVTAGVLFSMFAMIIVLPLLLKNTIKTSP